MHFFHFSDILRVLITVESRGKHILGPRERLEFIYTHSHFYELAHHSTIRRCEHKSSRSIADHESSRVQSHMNSLINLSWISVSHLDGKEIIISLGLVS